ncbi:MAG: phosphoribosyl-AMP cyclohydrolase [Bacteroidota bacterium]
MRKIILSLVVIVMTASLFTSELVAQEKSDASVTISDQEVLDIQKVWGEGIVHIGEVYSEGGDYKATAEKHIDKLYGYQLGTVFFKPTMASEKQFRLSKRGALSYFVGHDPEYAEDHGFAIKPWSNVRWESVGVKTIGNMSIALGNYYFTPADGGDEVKVEYTFVYTKDEDGSLRIIGHGSHFPYNPDKTDK